MLSKSFKCAALLAASSLALSGCISSFPDSQGYYAKPIGRAPVVSNPSPYSAALVCLGQYARANGRVSPRIAVGRISDLTGKFESDGSGNKLTQGASHMAITALGKAGVLQSNRFDTSVSDMELNYANQKLISDNPNPVPGQPNDYRRIFQGQVPGSNFNITGAITELNFNERSTGGDIAGGELRTFGLRGRLGSRTFVMSVAIDLQLNNTISQEIEDTVSYRKQVIGYEVGGGMVDFLNGNMFDLSAGESGLEPLQMAVRSLVERAMVEFVANVYGVGPSIFQSCMTDDPWGPGGGTAGLTGGFTPAYNNLGTNNAQTRADPYRWMDNGGGVSAGVRSRY